MNSKIESKGKVKKLTIELEESVKKINKLKGSLKQVRSERNYHKKRGVVLRESRDT